MSDKIIGFSIEINGQKQILEVGQAFGLLNTQLILLNDSFNKLAANSQAAGETLGNSLKSSASSADKLGNTFKKAAKEYGDASKKITDLGNGYFEVEEAVKDTTKRLKQNEAATKELTKEDTKRLRQLNKKIKLTKEEEQELKQLLKVQQLQRALARERNNIAKQETIIALQGAKSRAGQEAQLKLVTLQLSKLTKAQTLFTSEGRKLTKQQKQLNKAVSNYRSSLRGANSFTNKFQKSLTRFALKLTVGRSIIDGLANGVGAAIEGLKGLIEEADGTNEVFNEINNSGDRLTAVLKDTGRNFLNAFGGVISDVIDNVAFVISNVASSLSSAAQEQGLFSKVLNFGLNILRNFPAILGGIGGIINELTGRFKRFAVETSLSFEQVKLSIQRAADIIRGRDVSDIDKRLREVRQELEANTIASKTFSKAYADGFNNTKKAQAEFKKRSQDLADEEKKQAAEREAREERKEAAEKAREERRKKALEAAKKLLEDQEKALSKADEQRLARLSTIQELTKEIEDLQAVAIEDNTERLLKQEDNRYSRQEAQRKANFEKIKEEIQGEQEEISRLFGAGSEEAQANQAKAEAELLQLQQQFDQLAEQQEKAHQANIKQITEEGGKARKDLLISQGNERLEFIKSLDAQIQQTNKQTSDDATQQLIDQENERFLKLSDARTKAFEDYKKKLEKQSEELSKSLVGDPDKLKEEQAKIAKDLAEAQGKTNKLREQQEKEHQDKVTEITGQAEKDRQRELRDAAVSIYEEAAGALTSFLQIAAEADKARFEAAIAARQENLNNLNEKLENATGLQKRFLERQVKDEKEALKEEQKAQKESERARAKEAKIVGLGIAAINGAIAITRAFSDLGPIAGAVAAVGVAATLAVQIAEISAQKFQDGGLLEGNSHAKGGMPVRVGGSKVVEAEGGEFIVNKLSTAANFDLIKAINDSKGRVKFQSGGILGTPSIAPSVQGSRKTDNAASAELAAIQANANAITAVNQTLKTMKVNLVYPELQEEDSKTVAITQKTTL